jgi:HAE1 family hydrophobic/amphiphilic exporter-1
MAEIPGTRNAAISHKVGKPELQFRVKRREALNLGLSPYEIAATVRAAYKGVTVSRYSEDEESYDVVVILREEDQNPDRFSSLYFINPTGARIPLENLVDIVEGTGPVSVSRKARTRVMSVTAGLTGERALNRVTDDLKEAVAALGPPPLGIELNYTGTSQEMAESYSSLFLALVFAVALVYMVMASQFESLLHPFIVMFSVPFAIIGLVAALLITNTTFSLLAFVGGILLVGIVVNNAIVLIDYINLLRKRGVPLREAIVKGGKTRLKPILMTSLTTIFGLLPMSLGFGLGAEIRAPMGRSVVGGLTTSTLVTLVLIPVLYWIVESKLRRKKHEEVSVEATPVE